MFKRRTLHFFLLCPVSLAHCTLWSLHYFGGRTSTIFLLNIVSIGVDTIIPPEVLYIYANGSKLDNGVGSGIYSGKLSLHISLRLFSDYRRVFQVKVMTIYRADQ